jgi:hypothetical protein
MKTKTKRKIDQVASKNYAKLGKKFTLIKRGKITKLKAFILVAFALGSVSAVVWGFSNGRYSGSSASTPSDVSAQTFCAKAGESLRSPSIDPNSTAAKSAPTACCDGLMAVGPTPGISGGSAVCWAQSGGGPASCAKEGEYLRSPSIDPNSTAAKSAPTACCAGLVAVGPAPGISGGSAVCQAQAGGGPASCAKAGEYLRNASLGPNVPENNAKPTKCCSGLQPVSPAGIQGAAPMCQAVNSTCPQVSPLICKDGETTVSGPIDASRKADPCYHPSLTCQPKIEIPLVSCGGVQKKTCPSGTICKLYGGDAADGICVPTQSTATSTIEIKCPQIVGGYTADLCQNQGGKFIPAVRDSSGCYGPNTCKFSNVTTPSTEIKCPQIIGGYTADLCQNQGGKFIPAIKNSNGCYGPASCKMSNGKITTAQVHACPALPAFDSASCTNNGGTVIAGVKSSDGCDYSPTCQMPKQLDDSAAQQVTVQPENKSVFSKIGSGVAGFFKGFFGIFGR